MAVGEKSGGEGEVLLCRGHPEPRRSRPGAAPGRPSPDGVGITRGGGNALGTRRHPPAPPYPGVRDTERRWGRGPGCLSDIKLRKYRPWVLFCSLHGALLGAAEKHPVNTPAFLPPHHIRLKEYYTQSVSSHVTIAMGKVHKHNYKIKKYPIRTDVYVQAL